MLCIFVFSLFAEASYAQPLLPPLNLENTTISQALKTIEKQSDYVFLIADDAKAELNKTISIKTDRSQFSAVLDRVLRNTSLSYVVTGNQVVITKEAASQSPARQPANSVTITGRVTDTNGSPLIGAAVILKSNQTLGVSTDANGRFSITIPSGNSNVLVVTYLGMTTKEVPVVARTTDYNIILEASDTQIEEVNVISTGIFVRDRVTSTGNAPTYTQADLKLLGGNNILQGLSIADPSLRIVQNTLMGSDPNTMPTMELRGMSTPTLNMVQDEFSKDPNSPLFLINGVEVKIEKVVDLDMNRVESITILKDAGSTAIWGSKGANGVVVIELLKPKPGDYNISYNGSFAVEGPDLSVYNMMDAQEKYDFDVLAGKFSRNGLAGIELKKFQNKIKNDIASGVDTYWLAEPVRTGFKHGHSLRISGGSEELSIDVGAKFSNQEGAMKGSSRQSWGGDINLTYRVNKWIISNSLDISGYNAKGSNYGSYQNWVEAIPYYKKYNEYGGIDKWLHRYDGLGSYETEFVGGYSPVTEDVPNPLWNAQLNNKDQTNQFYVSNTLFIQYDVNPNLRFSGSLELMREESEEVKFKDPNHTDFAREYELYRGKYTNTERKSWWYKLSVSMAYTKAFDKHRLTFLANAKIKDERNNYYMTEAIGFPLNSKGSPNLALAYNIIESPGRPGYNNKIQREVSTAAVFNYSYDRRYLVDLTANLDGTTSFGANKLYKPFYSVGLGWNISEEEFTAGWNNVDLMKLSLTYGTNGNQNIGKVYSKSVYQYYIYSNVFGQGAKISNLGAPNVPWQAVDKFEVTFNVNMKRFSLKLNYYNEVTDPLIISMTQIPSTGLSAFPIHIGKVTKNGFDWDLKFYPIYNREQQITWSVSVNGDHYKAKYSGFDKAMEGMNKELNESNIMQHYKDGCAPYDLWAVPSYGVDPASGREIFIKKDGSLTYLYDAADQVVVGSTRPKFSGSIYSTFQYRNFDMTLAFQYQWGAHKYNTTVYNRVENISKAKLGSTNQDRRALHDRWQDVGDIAKHPGIKVTDSFMPMTSRLIQKDNYLNGTSIRLGYKLYNNEWLVKNLGISRLQVDLEGKDLFRLETSKVERGIEYPFARTITMNLTIGF